ncbi:hypothetical protein [Bacillus cereus]|uniref:hypothetical protein n=1 Tax=Bacillus cereus TaxID=1396 RepID=UPI001F426D64|nr:hypothetical protein [Bacillus cereus]BCC56130.1 hypothetical protein BCJMU07_5480 [Bacillus cereus]
MQGLLFDRYILNNKIDNIKIDDIDNKLKILKGWVNKFEILSQKMRKIYNQYSLKQFLKRF